MSDLIPEIWKPVVGFEGSYSVSNLGRVQSHLTGKILKPHRTGDYLGVALRRVGRTHSTYIHHLVAFAFIGERPSGMDICHNDGNRKNCRVDNLRYDTRNANMRDAIEQGTHRSVGRTVCKHGHALTPENTLRYERLSTDGAVKHRIRCRECNRLRSARWNEKVRLRRLNS